MDNIKSQIVSEMTKVVRLKKGKKKRFNKDLEKLEKKSSFDRQEMKWKEKMRLSGQLLSYIF